MQDLAILRNSDFENFLWRMLQDPLIIVLEFEDGITRCPKSNFALGPYLSLGAMHCILVRISIVACFAFTHYYKGVFRNFQCVLLLPKLCTKMCSDNKFIKLGMRH